MARPRDPLSKRNENETFTGSEIRKRFEKLAASKRAKKVRTGEEFDVRNLLASIRPPLTSQAAYSWTLEQIQAARDDQMRGKFDRPSKLAKSMRTDDAIFTAWTNRLAPQLGLSVVVKGKGAVRKEGEALFGQDGIGTTPGAVSDAHEVLFNLGVSVAVNEWSPRPDGSRVDVKMHAWPMEWVRYDDLKRTLVTRVDGVGGEVPITHGDGRWTVFSKHEREPWTKQACILPAALVWSRHAFGLRDWTAASYSQGNSKVKGELPPEFAFFDQDGSLTPQAVGFLEILKAAAGTESLAAIVPPGAKMEYLATPSNMHQIWTDITNNAERAAARIYLGTDGTLGAPGGAPGVDIMALFGVANTIGEGDLRCLSRGIQEGIIDPWCAINFGSSEAAPTREYVIPDADAQRVSLDFADRMDKFNAGIAAAKANGFVIDQPYVDGLVEAYGVPSPTLGANSVHTVTQPIPSKVQ